MGLARTSTCDHLGRNCDKLYFQYTTIPQIVNPPISNLFNRLAREYVSTLIGRSLLFIPVHQRFSRTKKPAFRRVSHSSAKPNSCYLLLRVVFFRVPFLFGVVLLLAVAFLLVVVLLRVVVFLLGVAFLAGLAFLRPRARALALTEATLRLSILASSVAVLVR
jgi:hypothetical protein